VPKKFVGLIFHLEIIDGKGFGQGFGQNWDKLTGLFSDNYRCHRYKLPLGLGF
jgi:hypothetical protein